MEGQSKAPGRNIVICLDGTGDWAGSGYTNVAKIYQALDRDSQLCYYDGGVGTLSPPQALNPIKRGLLRLLDLGAATSLREKTLQAYSFLVANYQGETDAREADRIFLFGFSRGAFTARLLASMIYNFGLLRPECAHLAPYLWQTIADFKFIGRFKDQARRIKVRFCREPVLVHFIGLFDTVSSVGVIGRFKTYPNTDWNPIVKRACHAVSIDEQRNVFPESLMHPGQQGLTEVWFPGVHRDTGGGLAKSDSRISEEALNWMETEAVGDGLVFDGQANLRLEERRAPHRPNEENPPRPNYPDYDPYVIGGLYPMNMFNKRVSGFRRIWPNFRHARVVPEFALVHPIYFRLKEIDRTYLPTNVPENVRPFEPGAQAPSHYVLPETPMNLPDLVGISFGTALLFMIWNHQLGSPLGYFPQKPLIMGWRLSTWLGVLFGAFLFCQMLGQKVADVVPPSYRLRSDGILPLIGVLIGGAVLWTYRDWDPIWWGLGGGVALFLVAQTPPLPVLRADRVLPYVLGATLLTGPILSYFAPRISINSFQSMPDPPLCLAALLLASIGAAALLVADRIKMAPIAKKSAEAAKLSSGS